MKLLLITMLAASCAVIPTLPQEAALSQRENHIAVRLGVRDLTGTLTTWHTGVEQLTVFGIEYARKEPGAPVGFEAGILRGEGDSTAAGFPVDLSQTEFYAGIHTRADSGNVIPYFGAGLTFMKAELEDLGGSIDDTSTGLYAHGGIDVPFTDAVAFNVDVRGVFGTEFQPGEFSHSVSGDYLQMTFGVVFSF